MRVHENARLSNDSFCRPKIEILGEFSKSIGIRAVFARKCLVLDGLNTCFKENLRKKEAIQFL